MTSDTRGILLNLFSHAIDAVNGRRCVAAFLAQQPFTTQGFRVIAIGKAAAAMLQGVLDDHADQVQAALVITKQGHAGSFAPDAPVVQIESAHPFADQRSLDAGQALLAFLRESASASPLLFLISGGSSALVEVLPDGVDARTLQAFNRWLLAQGWPIDVMNRVRKSVSLIKSGRLAVELGDCRVLQLLISDVPGDELSVIGSGLLVPDADPVPLPAGLPDWVRTMQAGVTPPPGADDACFRRIESHIIANNRRMREAAVAAAQATGLTVHTNAELDGDAVQLGSYIGRRLYDAAPGIYIWGGEPVVRLPENPGRGGRCQQLALAAACELDGRDGVMLLAAGSDGNDGPGDVAGALVDGGTLSRARDGGATAPQMALATADAGRFLAASGDLIDTGPTGTNVMDLVIGLKA